MTDLEITNPKILVAQFIPMGKNHMLSFNRHIGAHKSYLSPTEFGLTGAVRDLSLGNFQMEERGVLLSVKDAEMHSYADIVLREFERNDQSFSLKLNKDGLSYLGGEFPDAQLTCDQIKILIGKINYKVTTCVYPILADIQQDLLAVLYGYKNNKILLENPYATPSYALVICDDIQGTKKYKDSNSFLQAYPNKLEAITDWILWNKTIDNVHLFVGMRATICIGKPNEVIKQLLEILLFLNSMLNSSFRMFSNIWSFSKTTKNLKNIVGNARYNQLKNVEKEMIVLGGQLTLLQVLDKTLDEALLSTKEKWVQLKEQFSDTLHEVIPIFDKYFDDEIEKAKDRDLVLEIITADVDALQGLVSQRIDLILTKNSENLNLLVLLFTLISLFGIAEAIFYDQAQWLTILLASIPFLFALVIYTINYIRNFLKR